MSYLDAVYSYVQEWYYYFFCKDQECIPLDPRNVIVDDDLVSLNRVMHYYKKRKLRKD